MKWNDTVRRWAAALLLVAGSLALAGCTGSGSQPSVDLGEVDISQFRTEQPYVELNGNQPAFTDKEKKNTEVFETYSDLDSLGRCGVAQANLCRELMPTEPRGRSARSSPPGGTRSSMTGWTASICITAATSSASSWPGRTPTRRTSPPAPAL